MKLKLDPCSITVTALNWHSIWTVSGPHQTCTAGFIKASRGSDRHAFALSNALRTIPFNSFAKSIHGKEYADKKIPAMVRTDSADFITLCLKLSQMDEAPEENNMLWQLMQKYELSFRLIDAEAVAPLKSWYRDNL